MVKTQWMIIVESIVITYIIIASVGVAGLVQHCGGSVRSRMTLAYGVTVSIVSSVVCRKTMINEVSPRC